MNSKPKLLDAFILSCFAVFITCQPYLLHHEIIMMESGIHLPGIQAFSRGAVPYRDFLYLRGPLEFYIPAFMMNLFGQNMVWLPIFYYTATILTLILLILLGFQLYRTRLIFYLMVPVFVARTFPRISFYYWGGLRYALGILALVFAVKTFKSRKMSWMLGSGVVSCLAFWTTIEAGVVTVFSVGGSLILLLLFDRDERAFYAQALMRYIFGFLIIFVPVILLMSLRGSLIPYIETTYVVLTRSFKTFPNGPGIHPVGITGFLRALFPGSKFFKSMTPVYFYIILFTYLVRRERNKTFDLNTASLICIALYGIALFITGFRRLDGHHFEMALQPEKVLFFFILEEVYFYLIHIRKADTQRMKGMVLNGWQFLWARKKIYCINFMIFALIGSSLGYSFKRYHKRFVVVKYLQNKLGLRHDKDLSLLHEVEKRPVNIERAKGMVVPTWQADEMEGIVGFLQKNTKPDEIVFSYPEVGNFNFWADRPFVGRFPIVTFSWMKEEWFRELVHEFKKINPRYVIMTNLGHRTFPEEWYFRNKSNIKKFNEMTNLILENYSPVRIYESVSLYERNNIK